MQFTLTSVLSLRERKQICRGGIDSRPVVANLSGFSPWTEKVRTKGILVWLS
jgi:hypothetical protein